MASLDSCSIGVFGKEVQTDKRTGWGYTGKMRTTMDFLHIALDTGQSVLYYLWWVNDMAMVSGATANVLAVWAAMTRRVCHQEEQSDECPAMNATATWETLRMRVYLKSPTIDEHTKQGHHASGILTLQCHTCYYESP